MLVRKGRIISLVAMAQILRAKKDTKCVAPLGNYCLSNLI
jgi:hypothetical protein